MPSSASASSSPGAVPAAGAAIPRHVWIISGVAMLGAVMSILDTTIVNVALATLATQLHTTLSNIQWVVTGYMLSLAAVIPITGWASRRFGAKRVFLISLVLFTIGSGLCGLASTATELILFRVLQGVGGGMIMPLAQIIMAGAAGPKNMGKVMGLVAVPMMLAPTLGPVLGGVIIQAISWHWIFYVNLIVGAIAIPLAIRVLPSQAGTRGDRLDLTGLVLGSTGLVAISYGIAEWGTYNTGANAHVWAPILAGVLLLVGFAYNALHSDHPLLNLRLYRSGHFSAASFVMFALGAAVFGAMILMPLYWQDLRHYSVIDAGLLVGPQGIGMAFGMPLASRMTERYGGGPVALGGVLATAIFTVPFALIGAHTSIPYLVAMMVLRGFAMGCSFMPAMTAAFAALEPSEVSHATPQLNVLNRVGGSIGTTVLAVVLADSERGARTLQAGAHAFGIAFWVSVGLALAAVPPCIILMRSEQKARVAARAAGIEDPDHVAIDTGAVAEALV